MSEILYSCHSLSWKHCVFMSFTLLETLESDEFLLVQWKKLVMAFLGVFSCIVTLTACSSFLPMCHVLPRIFEELGVVHKGRPRRRGRGMVKCGHLRTG